MPATPTRDDVKHAASALHIPRAVARALLAYPRELRADLLVEVARVGAGRVLAYTKTQPDKLTA